MCSNPRILIVDNDPLWLQTLADYLRQHRFRVRAAGDCRTALAEIERQPVELILLDFHMPDADGPSLLDRLRARGNHTPVVILSGDDDPHLPDRAEDAGATAFLTKTMSPRLLLRTVHRLLGSNVRHATDDSAGHNALPHAHRSRWLLPVVNGDDNGS